MKRHAHRVRRAPLHHLGLVLVAVAAGLPLAAEAAELVRPGSVAERSDASATQALRLAIEAFRQNDCAKATRLVAPLIAADAAPLPMRMRPFAYNVMARCAFQAGARDEAYRYAAAATAVEGAPDELWQFRFAIAVQGKLFEEAVATVEAMARDHPAVLNSTAARWLYDLDNHLATDGTVAQRRRLLAVMTGGRYAPVDPMTSLDYFHYRLAVLLTDAGDSGAATREMIGVHDPSVLFDANLDPRLRATLPPNFDLRRAVEQGLAEMRSLASQHPELIAPVVRSAGYLRALGRPQEAVQVLEALRPRIGHADAFRDATQQTSWWWNMLAENENALGHYDGAIAAMRSGAGAGENGGANVSQVINLASYQLQYGHYGDVLATIALFDKAKRNVSGYGMMQIQLIRGCARLKAGKRDDATAELSYLRVHEKDDPTALTDMLMCFGDLDGAAASYVHRLDDPAQRVEALRQLSDYDAPPVKVPENPFEADLPAIKARPDIQAAIARAGGARHISLQFVHF